MPPLHTILHPTDFYPHILFEEAKGQLDQLNVPADNVPAERRFETGDPASEVLRVAKKMGADLIVIGTHGRTGLSRLLMGSTAEQIVRRATCPVLTVKMPLPSDASGSETRTDQKPLHEQDIK